MKVRLRLCDDCAVTMITKEGFDMTHMVSYHPTKESQCSACEYRGYPRVYLTEIAPTKVAVS